MMQWIGDYRPGAELPGLFGCVATLGVFDGVHVGHRAILDRTLHWAKLEQRKAVVITFSVHPDQVIRGQAPPLLLSLEHRRRELERCGLDAAVVLTFDQELRQMAAETFVERILVQSLRIRGLVLGHDTAVGLGRRGNAALLDRLGGVHGFEVKVVGEIAVDGTVVSSSRIRDALQHGDLEEASRLLGRPPALVGRVRAGDGLGRKLGFPTANLDPATECHPAGGVYAVLVTHRGRCYEGLCNIGRRPTLGVEGELRIEVHLLDHEGDLYGEELEVVFLAKLRDERRFAGLDQLRAQIAVDRKAAEPHFERVRGRRNP